MKVSQDGPPGGRFRSVVTGENPSNHVLVDGDGESQGNLLSDARTAPGGITSLHFDDGIDQLFRLALRTRTTPAPRRKQQAIFPLCQHLVKMQER